MKNSSENEEKELSLHEINAQNNKILSRMLFWFWIMLIFLWIWNTKWSPIHPIFDISPADLWDSINIFNALIGAITISFIYGAYNLQQEAFVLQKKELKETRKTLENQEKEMQEQNRQQYIKFLLEQKNNMLEQIHYKDKKWFTIFNYWANRVFRLEFWWDISEIEELISYWDWRVDAFDNFYSESKYLLDNYKNLCYHLENELKKSKNTKNLTFLAISLEEQFCFDLMRLLDEYWKRMHREDEWELIENKNPPKN